ncbi:hypothetical protein SMC26_00650 [Actinomadura fulvescens]|uniref:Uncharacterized protein n=1 Tax=Actinomadura fulvescens TaxID=46160 RepID=A0ABN3PPZ7_9ACTN
MNIEDRLRDALRATANTVDDQTHRPLPERRPRPSLLRRRLVPLGAVVAVLLLLVGFVAAQRLWDDEPAPHLQRTPVMPKFIFSSTLEAGRTPSDPGTYRLEVRESATGRLLDRHQAPKGITFHDVAALSDNRTFYVTSELSSQKPCRTTIQRVRVSDAGKIIALEPVAAPLAGTAVRTAGRLAVTPNGTKLAYALEACGEFERAGPSAERTRIAVIDLVGNTRREWRDSGRGDGANHLSWTADGERLFFVRRVQPKRPGTEEWEAEELRVIDASVPGEAELAANSSVIQTLKAPQVYEAALASPDGRSVITSSAEVQLGVGSSQDFEAQGDGSDSAQSSSNEPVELLELSVQDGRTLRQIRLAGTPRVDVNSYKNDASGLYLLTSGGIVDLHKGGPARPLKGFDSVIDFDW